MQRFFLSFFLSFLFLSFLFYRSCGICTLPRPRVGTQFLSRDKRKEKRTRKRTYNGERRGWKEKTKRERKKERTARSERERKSNKPSLLSSRYFHPFFANLPLPFFRCSLSLCISLFLPFSPIFSPSFTYTAAWTTVSIVFACKRGTTLPDTARLLKRTSPGRVHRDNVATKSLLRSRLRRRAG